MLYKLPADKEIEVGYSLIKNDLFILEKSHNKKVFANEINNNDYKNILYVITYNACRISMLNLQLLADTYKESQGMIVIEEAKRI